ncbi:MAG: TatD family hydrolase [Nitrososphaeria archaeon]|nr:TatD family hydrolase [Nitrososphaeria archaeon]
MFPLVDAHVHFVDDELKPYLDWIISSCSIRNVIVFSNSMDFISSKLNLELSSKYNFVKAFIGVHPWCVQSYSSLDFKNLLEENIDYISGVGEIGLDGKYDFVSMSVQRKVFEEQLALAERYNLPVNVHSRRAQENVIEILSSYKISRILLHWFSGDERMLKKGLDMGCFFSFGPTLLYSKSTKKLFQKCDTSRVLVETDAPVAYGVCFEGYTSSPLLLSSIVYTVSNLFKKSLEETLNIILENSESYLGGRLLGDELSWV